MLNKVLLLLEEHGVFAQMEREEAQQLVLDIVKLSDHYDCNKSEILEEVGERLGICWVCRTAKPDLIKGICVACRAREGLALELDADEETTKP
jgi:hypothetical protein